LRTELRLLLAGVVVLGGGDLLAGVVVGDGVSSSPTSTGMTTDDDGSCTTGTCTGTGTGTGTLLAGEEGVVMVVLAVVK
jgi:hypothetical protein